MNFILRNDGTKQAQISIQFIEIDDKRDTSALDVENIYPLVCSSLYINSRKNESKDEISHDSGIRESQIEISIQMKRKKVINIHINDTVTYMIPDFLASVSGFFQCPFDKNAYPVPNNVRYIHDDDPPGMDVNIHLTRYSLIFLTSYEVPDDPAILVKISSSSLAIS